LLIDGDFPSILKGISAVLPPTVFHYKRVAVLELRERREFRKYGGVRIRQAHKSDLEPLARCLRRAKPGLGDFRKRWDRGDICFLAEADGSAVAVTWASFHKYRMEEVDYVFDPGNGGVYLYDAYTVPEWRLRGVHVNLMEHLLEALPDRSVRGVYCAVEHGNRHSLRTHLRFGFQIARHVVEVRLMGLRWHRVKRVAAAGHEPRRLTRRIRSQTSGSCSVG